jgi:hypothetical protein
MFMTKLRRGSLVTTMKGNSTRKYTLGALAVFLCYILQKNHLSQSRTSYKAHMGEMRYS